MSEIEQRLRRIRRRIVNVRLVSNLAQSLLLASAIFLAGSAVLFLRGRFPWSPEWLMACLGGALGAAIVWTVARRPTLIQTARLIDTLGGTRDRFTTGLTLDAEVPSPLVRLAVADCEQFVRHFRAGPLLPFRIPRRLLALLAPAAAVGLMVWQFQIASRPDAAALAAQEELLAKADELESLMRKLEEAGNQKSPEMERILEAMRKSIERLRQAAAQKNVNPADALRELSSLESLIAAMQTAQKPPANPLKDLAQQLEKQDMPESMESQARSAAEKMGLSQEAQQELERAMQEAREQSSDAARSEALQRLAEMLRQMAQQQRPQDARGRQQVSRNLQMARMALQEMKAGRYSRSSGRSEQPGDGDTPILLQSFDPGDKEGRQGMTFMNLPGGQPGSEKDEGSTETPFGEKHDLQEKKGAGSQLTSVLGEGESLTDLVPAAGDTSKSTQRYRDLYKAIAGASEGTVEQENIPLASRFFIKRYFQKIRPKE